MARVIPYDNFTVAPTGPGAGTFRAPSTEGFGYAARELQQTAQRAEGNNDRLMGIALDIQGRENEAKVKEADTALSNRLRDVLNNPESGYLNQQGKNAVDRRADTQQAIDDAIREIGAGLDNPETMRMWSSASTQRQQQAFNQIDNHAANQTTVYRVQSSVARMEAAVQDGAANIDDPAARSRARATGAEEVKELAALKGFDADQTKQALLEYNTTFHQSVLNTLLTSDRGPAALAYLASNKDQIDPTKYDDMAKTVRGVADKTQAVKLADQLGDAFVGRPIDADKELRKKFEAGDISADVRDAASQRVWEAYGREQRIAGDQYTEGRRAMQSAADGGAPDQGGVRGLVGNLFPGAVFTSGARDDNSALGRANPGSYHNYKNGGRALDIRPIPGVSFNQFVGTLRANGLNIVEAIDEVKRPSRNATGPHWHIAWSGAAPDAKIKTDPEYYAELLQSAAEDPSGFARMDLKPYAAHLSPGDYRVMLRKQASAARGDEKAMDSLATVGRTMSYLKGDLAAARIDTSPKPGDTAYATYQTALQREIDREQERLKRPLNDKEAVAIGRGLLAQGTIEGAGWFGAGRPARAYELQTPGEKYRFRTETSPSIASQKVPFTRIPPASRRAVYEDFVRREGRAPTQREIENIYPIFKSRGNVK